jgi:hypothetical protein
MAGSGVIVDHVDTVLHLHAQRADAATDAGRDTLQQRIGETDAQIDRRMYELYGLGTEEIEIVEANAAR